MTVVVSIHDQQSLLISIRDVCSLRADQRAATASMKTEPIKNNRDYGEALKEIHRLMDARPKTTEGERLDVLVTMVEAWEEQQLPINSVHDPAFDQQGEAAKRVMREDRYALKKLAE